MLGSYYVAAQLAASQEGLSSMKLVYSHWPRSTSVEWLAGSSHALLKVLRRDIPGKSEENDERPQSVDVLTKIRNKDLHNTSQRRYQLRSPRSIFSFFGNAVRKNTDRI
jgi:hypothetical protein